MILTDEQIIEKYAIICPSCNRKTLCYLMLMNGVVISCNYNIIKQKHELILKQSKKLTFSSRIKYAEQKIIAICTDIIQIYDGHDYKKMLECFISN